MDPSKPNDPQVDQPAPIPRSRPANEEVLEGEVIDRGVPLGRQPPPPSPSVVPPKRKPRTLRMVLLVLAVVAAFAVFGTALTVFLIYRKAAEPDRSNPTSTLQQYLDARFNSRDTARAGAFVCQSPNLSSVDEMINEVEQREKKYQIHIRMFTSSMSVISQTSTSATVRTELTVEIPEEGARSSGEVYIWQFDLVWNSSGWRVCSATRAS